MPLGVDHQCFTAIFPSNSLLKLPLMPLGVDHTLEELKEEIAANTEITFDAVRR